MKRSLIILLSLPLYKFELMAQQPIVSNDGIANITIGMSVSRVENLVPINKFTQKKKYFFEADSSLIYFLSKGTEFSPDLDSIEDLFVIADLDRKIRLINIFLNSQPKDIESLLTKKFGKAKYTMESSVSGNSGRKRYVWISNSNIEFMLKVENVSGTEGARTISNLLIFGDLLSDHLGDWNISRISSY